MTAPATVRRLSDDRGAGYIAAFIVLLPTLLLAGVGIVIDSARYYTSFRQADAVAMEAARAGANSLDRHSLGEGGAAVDAASAQATSHAAASAYVSSTGLHLDSVAVNGNQVVVSVSGTVDSWFPLLGDRTVTRTASARAISSRAP